MGFVNLYTNFAAPGGILSTNGSSPGEIILGRDGNLYGFCQFGGSSNTGTIFSLGTNGLMHWQIPASDGAGPNGLLQGLDGNIYVWTASEILSITPSGIISWSAPQSGKISWMLQGTDGNLYATESTGNSNNYGGVISLSTNGSPRWSVPFNKTNGSYTITYAGPTIIQGQDGNLYGTTTNGGLHNDGVLYSMTTNGIFNWEFSFAGTNGTMPYGNLFQGIDGNLYGPTQSGGAQGLGVVYGISTNGVQKWIWSVPSGGANKAGIYALTQDAAGNFYGVDQNFTNFFCLSTNGALRWNLATPQGTDFSGSLMVRKDGYLYSGGQAEADGVLGMIFCISPSGQLVAMTNVASSEIFAGTEGFGWAQDSTGNIFGVFSELYTPGEFTGGEICKLVAAPTFLTQPTNILATAGSRVSFTASVLAAPPYTCQWQKNRTNLSDIGNVSGSTTNTLVLTNVGVSDVAGYSIVVSNFFGSITSGPARLALSNSFPTLQSDGSLSVISSFTGGSLQNPYAITAGSDGTLYVSTVNGYIARVTTNAVVNWSLQRSQFFTWTELAQGQQGNIYAADGAGVISYSTNGILLNTLNQSSSGGSFAGILEDSGHRVYWTSLINRSIYCTSTNFQTTYWQNQFSNNLSPNALFLGNDNRLYGTAQVPGLYTNGTVFCMNTNGTLVWSLLLTGPAAIIPAGVVQGADGNLYGTTTGDGTNSFGSVFSVTSAGVLNWLAPLPQPATGGNFPYPRLMQATDGNIYGTTRSGGAFNAGSIYQVTKSGGITPVYNFSGGTDGSNPSAGLVQMADGTFYGTAEFGGPSNTGLLFHLNLGLPPIAVPPVINNVAQTNGTVILIWTTISNLNYQLQYTCNLASGIWSNVGSPVLSSGTTMSMTDTVTVPQRFYRVAIPAAQ
jgi:uncharacterized repeat protein (TIGR03803 family)